MPPRSSIIIAVDFDGTVVDHRFPDVGQDVPEAANVLTVMVKLYQARIILWTMRSGQALEDAKTWFAVRGISLFGVNSNPQQVTWTSSPKAYAHAYVDDAAIGVPLIHPENFARPCVDWPATFRLLHEKFWKEKRP